MGLKSTLAREDAFSFFCSSPVLDPRSIHVNGRTGCTPSSSPGLFQWQ